VGTVRQPHRIQVIWRGYAHLVGDDETAMTGTVMPNAVLTDTPSAGIKAGR
jgi:hypothetical protein